MKPGWGRVDLKRLAGAAAIAVVLTALFSISPLLRDGGIAATETIVALLATGLIGFLAWLGVEHAWAHRGSACTGKRLLAIGIGAALAVLLTQAVQAFGGADRQIWSFLLIVVLLAALGIAVAIELRRARRS